MTVTASDSIMYRFHKAKIRFVFRLMHFSHKAIHGVLFRPV